MAAASADERDVQPTKRLVSASGFYVSAYAKSLRKTGFTIRYIFVPELHRNGFPHWHGLVHDLGGNLAYDDLDAAWVGGFHVTKLVRDARALRYVTKYLSKYRIGRVRASINYGQYRANSHPHKLVRWADPSWSEVMAPDFPSAPPFDGGTEGGGGKNVLGFSTRAEGEQETDALSDCI